MKKKAIKKAVKKVIRRNAEKAGGRRVKKQGLTYDYTKKKGDGK